MDKQVLGSGTHGVQLCSISLTYTCQWPPTHPLCHYSGLRYLKSPSEAETSPSGSLFQYPGILNHWCNHKKREAIIYGSVLSMTRGYLDSIDHHRCNSAKGEATASLKVGTTYLHFTLIQCRDGKNHALDWSMSRCRRQIYRGARVERIIRPPRYTVPHCCNIGAQGPSDEPPNPLTARQARNPNELSSYTEHRLMMLYPDRNGCNLCSSNAVAINLD